MSDNDQRAIWGDASTPSGKAPLSVDELEFLDRLCERGEALYMEGLSVSQINSLLREGCAESKCSYALPGGTVHLIVPTEKGKQISIVRKSWRKISHEQ